MSRCRLSVGLAARNHRDHMVAYAGISALASLVWACSPTPPTASDHAALTPLSISGPFTLTATSRAVRDPVPRLRITITISNTSNSTEQVEYGGCWSFLRLYKTADLSADPAFDQQLKINACQVFLTDLSLAAGGSAVLSLSYDVPTLIASGVSAGQYFLGIAVAPNAVMRVLAAGEADIQP